MFSYTQAAFDYEPYPIGRVDHVLGDADYDTLVATYPDISLFEYKPALGEKYSLSERNNAENYRRFIASSPEWAKVHAYLKSPRFIEETLAFLKTRNIDLALGDYGIVETHGKKKTSLASKLLGRTELSSRFEFSIMGGQGGHIRPHTDEPRKLITLVVSMIKPGEWDEAWGGGTEVCLPKDRTRVFNQANKYMGFEDVDVIRSYGFKPNQCVIFIKTYNSWHHVSPLTAPPGSPLRKTLTINIERLA